MDKYKRNERLAVMTQVLTAAPNKIFTLSHFCEMFGAAKSTVSEDAAILAETMRQFRLGTVETVTGAAGGMRYRPMTQEGEGRRFMEEICEMMRVMRPISSSGTPCPRKNETALARVAWVSGESFISSASCSRAAKAVMRASAPSRAARYSAVRRTRRA